jgi:hypothetical protein
VPDHEDQAHASEHEHGPAHEHDHAHDHGHEHEHGHEREHQHDHGDGHGHDAGEIDADISGWIAAAPKESCPACGALGALRLGGGLYCPACGETTTNPGYTGPPHPGDD